MCFCRAAHCSSLRCGPVGAAPPPRPPPRDTPNVASSLLHAPWRSGSPHGVLGGVQFAGAGPPLNAVITSGGVVAAMPPCPGPWLDTGSVATTTTIAATPHERRTRLINGLLLMNVPPVASTAVRSPPILPLLVHLSAPGPYGASL